MKNKFAFSVDVVFVCVITFILSLTLFNFFIPYPYSIVFSACAAAFATIFFFYRQRSSLKEKRLKREELKKRNELISELNFSTLAEQNAILERALKNAGLSPERKKTAITLKEQNAVIFCKFGFEKVSKTDILKAYNGITKVQTAYITAESFDSDAQAFAQRFDNKIRLVDGDAVYKYLIEHNAIPEFKYKCFSERKAKGSFKNLLDKKKAKTFFGFGIIFLLTSYITPLKIYNIVCGCLFLIYALALRLWGKEITAKAV